MASTLLSVETYIIVKLQKIKISRRNAMPIEEIHISCIVDDQIRRPGIFDAANFNLVLFSPWSVINTQNFECYRDLSHVKII